jgi:hypothetical protein
MAVLVVRHGPGRGRLEGYMEPALDFIRRARPDVARRLRLHATGGAPPDLDGIRAVLFWLADPLSHYPACHAEALRIAAEARARGIRLANPPEALLHSIKSVQARLWEAAGIPTPRHWRYGDRAGLLALLARSAYPLLVRADEEHSQTHMHVCRSRAEAERIPDRRLAYPGAVAEFVDVRAAHAVSDSGSLWAHLYHKKRLFVLGRIVRTNHIFFSRQPIVSEESSLFYRYTGWRAPLAAFSRVAFTTRACIDADNAYWAMGEEEPDLMRQAAAALGLDYLAIDYATLPGGRVILWEANPYFYLPPLAHLALPRQRHTADRLASFYGAIADFLIDLDAAAQP